MNKKTIGIAIGAVIVILLVVIGVKFLSSSQSGSQQNIEGTLEEIMDKLYADIPEDELPMLERTEVTQDNIEYYLGTSDIEYEEALASEPMMSSIAHSVVLIRLKDNQDAKEVVNKVKENVDPRKWVCVWVEDDEVKVVSKGNIVALIMVEQMSDRILDNFNKL